MSQRAVEGLRSLIGIETVSHRDRSLTDPAPFDLFLAELARLFPRLHTELDVSRVDGHGLLVHWPGAGSEHPVVLMAHLDVVPAAADDPWTHPAFGGDLVDGHVWGRGTLDDKGALTAICEAVETLLEEEVVPAQDVWLSFGCNEEVDGRSARAAADELARRGVRPWFVLDEGGAVAHQAFPGVARPVAVIGVAEKGTTSILLRAEGRGGHASTPRRLGPTARVARALTRLDAASMPARLADTTVVMLERMSAHAILPLRALLSRAGRIRPVVTRALLAAGPESAAMTRTTFALTTLSGSPALNVIAASATAGVNIRVMVGDTVDDVLEHVRRTIADPKVRIEVVERGEPSPVSPLDEAFELLEATVREVFPDAIPAPYIMMAATDSRFFTGICDRVYRFAPFRMTKAQRESIHSFDEHLGVDDFVDGIRWYRRLIEGLPR